MSTYVVPLYVLRAKRRGYEVSVMKSLMDLLGLAGGPVRPPLANLRPEEVESLRAEPDGVASGDLIGSIGLQGSRLWQALETAWSTGSA